MLAKIHIAKKELGLDDDTYRAVLMRVTGQASSAGLSFDQMDEVLAEFKARGWKPSGYRRTAVSASARKVYALWTELYQAKIVALPKPDGFVRRMTGKDRAEMLTPDEAGPVIEALKDWIKRAGLGGAQK